MYCGECVSNRASCGESHVGLCGNDYTSTGPLAAVLAALHQRLLPRNGGGSDALLPALAKALRPLRHWQREDARGRVAEVLFGRAPADQAEALAVDAALAAARRYTAEHADAEAARAMTAAAVDGDSLLPRVAAGFARGELGCAPIHMALCDREVLLPRCVMWPPHLLHPTRRYDCQWASLLASACVEICVNCGGAYWRPLAPAR